MKVAHQPWTDDELHREHTRSLSSGGRLSNRGYSGGNNPTIYSDPAEAAEHLLFLEWFKQNGHRSEDMSGLEFEALKNEWRKMR